jgi:hypothetical protein
LLEDANTKLALAEEEKKELQQTLKNLGALIEVQGQ